MPTVGKASAPKFTPPMAFFHEQIILPLSDLLTGQRVYHWLRFLLRSAQLDDAEMLRFQKERLHKLVTHAVEHVPYYRDLFAHEGWSANDFRALDDLRRLPVVNKAIMRSEGIDRFTSDDFPCRQRILVRSSGSTGEPFSYYTTRLAVSVNTAAKLRTWYEAGYRLGDCYMKIANGARHGGIKKIQDIVNNCIYIPFYSLDDDVLRTILNAIEKRRPHHIRAYPIPLYLLAQYRNSHSDMYSHRPCRIFTTGSTLPAAYRAEIECAFGCDVIDSYSCEGTPNTYETPAHDGYRVSREYGIIEVLDDHDQPVSDGIGRVVSTDLWNLAHPFIRYDTQDLVEVCNGQIQRIMGRECESLVDTRGGRYTVHNFVGFFQEDDRPTRQSVVAYQVVRHRDGSITFRLVVNDQYTPDIERYIVDHWHERLGVPVNVELVDAIPLMKNNKRLTIVND